MRRLPRIFLNTVTAASLVFFLATIGLWIRSYSIAEQWTFAPGPPAFAPMLNANARPFRWAGSSRGQLKLLEITLPERTGTFPGPPGYAPKLTFSHIRAADRQIAARGVRDAAYPGLAFESMPAQLAPSTRPPDWPGQLYGEATSSGYRSLVVSWWLPALFTSLLPALWIIRRTRPRQAAGHCPACGYDLRATPDRCPECGTIPAR